MDYKVSSPIWDFLENYMLLDIEKSFLSIDELDAGKLNGKSINCSMSLQRIFLDSKNLIISKQFLLGLNAVCFHISICTAFA